MNFLIYRSNKFLICRSKFDLQIVIQSADNLMRSFSKKCLLLGFHLFVMPATFLIIVYFNQIYCFSNVSVLRQIGCIGVNQAAIFNYLKPKLTYHVQLTSTFYTLINRPDADSQFDYKCRCLFFTVNLTEREWSNCTFHGNNVSWNENAV